MNRGDWLEQRLVEAISSGNKPRWDEIAAECRRAGRDDLPERVRKEWPLLAEQLDRT